MTALMDVLQGAIDIDTNIFLFINGMHNTFFDYFMSAYSGKWVWVPMYAAIWYVMLRNFHWKVTLFCMVGLALVITIADQTGATLIRPYVERLRPANLENPISDMVHIVNGHRGGRYGFPSCHAANTFGLAFFVWFLFRKRWLTVFMMGWALLTCYSRVYLGVHYPGDLIAGTLVGLIAAYIVYRLFLKVSGYKTMKKVPHIYAPILVGGLTMAFPLYLTCPFSSTSTPGSFFNTSFMCTSLDEANCAKSYLTVSFRVLIRPGRICTSFNTMASGCRLRFRIPAALIFRISLL